MLSKSDERWIKDAAKIIYNLKYVYDSKSLQETYNRTSKEIGDRYGNIGVKMFENELEALD